MTKSSKYLSMRALTLSTLSVMAVSAILVSGCAENGGTPPSSAQLETLGIQAYQGKQEKALQQLRYWAEHGQTVAQRELALYYLTAQQGDADAVKWFRRAADGNDAEATYALAEAYYTPKLGLQKNLKQAWSWYQKAASLGDDRAGLMLSRMAKYGEGVTQDVVVSTHWLQQASERGNAQAMFLLSNAYLSGDGVARDPVLARTWLEKSARGDFPVAIQALALAVQGGDMDLQKDPERASHLLKEATDERRMHWNKAQ